MPQPTSHWWKNGTCYQIWPASYKDSNGDGLGDIPGILTTLDHLSSLGIDIIWLCPMYASPQVDMGYDISDYESVHAPYGTMQNMETLIKEVHARGMRIILDLVVNHTSAQHQWFKESRTSRTNEKANWYIWKDAKWVDTPSGGKERNPPNNWRSEFGPSAWEWVEERQQYYLHLFDTEMPDLNWECDAARHAIHESALRSWLRKGVDGFRVDVATIWSKDQFFPDAAIVDAESVLQFARELYDNGPHMHEWYREIRTQVLDDFGDVVLVGEGGPSDPAELRRYIGFDARELNMVFDFDMALLGGLYFGRAHELKRPDLGGMKSALRKTQELVSSGTAWASVFAENHDMPRSGRYTTTEPPYRERGAKLMACLLGSLSGTLFLFQGQEIGMTNIPTSWTPADLRDVFAKLYWESMELKHSSDKAMMAKAWDIGICQASRDNARTPVQWGGSRNAGFTMGEPWIRVNDNYHDINVAAQDEDEGSVLNFWRAMLRLRKEFADVFVHGAFEVFGVEGEDELEGLFVYTKRAESGRGALVVLNFSEQEREFSVPPKCEERDLRFLVGNLGQEKEGEGKVLEAWEGRIYVF